MDSEYKYQLFLVAFNPVAEHFNEIISIEPYCHSPKIQKDYKKENFELYVDGKKQPKSGVIGIRESYASACALALSYLKFHLKENREAMELLDFAFDNTNPT